MHEMGIALEVIKIASGSMPNNAKSSRVETINLAIGRLSAVVPKSLEFCFEIAVKETVLAGAKLNIEVIPVMARCDDCGVQWEITGPAFRCEKCESDSITILSGRELDVKSIEISEQ